jgi:hypothetical protein
MAQVSGQSCGHPPKNVVRRGCLFMNTSQLIAPFVGADLDQPTKRHGSCRLSFALDGKLGLFIPPRKNPAGSGAEGDVFAQVLPKAGFCYPQLLVFHPVV